MVKDLCMAVAILTVYFVCLSFSSKKEIALRLVLV